jgi:CMP-N,N'-diacetyllegionaminic acid synthase
MRVIGVVPARGGSQRLPGKNLLPLLGKPLILYTLEKALEATTLDRVVVSTDDDEIARVGRTFGAEVIARPPDLATADAAIDDALRHVVERLRTEERFVADMIVSMQANNPVRRKGEIDEVVRRLIETPWATAVATAYRVSQRPEWSKQVIDKRTMEIRSFMDAGTKYRMQDLSDLYLLDGSVIAIRAEVLEKTAGDRRVHAYLGERVTILVHDAKYAVELDTAQDVERAEFYLSRHE